MVLIRCCLPPGIKKWDTKNRSMEFKDTFFRKSTVQYIYLKKYVLTTVLVFFSRFLMDLSLLREDGTESGDTTVEGP